MDLPIYKYGKNERRKFGSINEVIDIPDLVEIQKDSYNSFIQEGISEVFEDFSPTTPTTLSFTFSTIVSATSRNTTRRNAATATRRTRFRCG